jgi:hypothetical protein
MRAPLILAIVALLFMFTACATLEKKNVNDTPEKIEIIFSPAQQGLLAFDPKSSVESRKKEFEKYINSEYLNVAFKRYSDSRRPPENRVDADLFRDFSEKVWQLKWESISNPRMQYIRGHYRWGVENFAALRSDLELVIKNSRNWLKMAQTNIPMNRPSVRVPEKTLKVVFLLDPGGSYPWVTEDEKATYIFVDLLQIRGFTDTERSNPIDEKNLGGMLTHELFHQFQLDRAERKSASQWIVGAAVAEGSACIIGNNAPDSSGYRDRANEPVYFGGKLLDEWNSEITKAPARLQEFINLVQKWEKQPPADSAKFEIMTKEKWIASPSNGLLMGELYRVGVEMLLKIKRVLGDAAFDEVVGDSSKLIPMWARAQSL